MRVTQILDPCHLLPRSFDQQGAFQAPQSGSVCAWKCGALRGVGQILGSESSSSCWEPHCSISGIVGFVMVGQLCLCTVCCHDSSAAWVQLGGGVLRVVKGAVQLQRGLAGCLVSASTPGYACCLSSLHVCGMCISARAPGNLGCRPVPAAALPTSPFMTLLIDLLAVRAPALLPRFS